MSNLKTGLSIVAGAVLATAIVGPKVVGSQFESVLNGQIAKLNETPGYKAEITSFESSWFASDAKISISLDLDVSSPNTDVNEEPMEPITSIIDVTAQHGPLLFNDVATFGWLTMTASVDGRSISENITTENNQPLYQITNHMTLLGNHLFNDMMPALEFNCVGCEQPLKIVYKGYEGKGQSSSAGVFYQGKGLATEFYVTEGELMFGNMNVDFTGDVSMEQLFAMGFYDSTARMLIEDVTYTNALTGQKVELTGLALTTDTQLDETTQLADMSIGYALETFKDGQYDGQDFDVEFEFTNIDSEFLKAYEGFLKQANEMIDSDPEQYNSLQAEFIGKHVLALVEANPHVNLTKLNGTFAQGSFNGQLDSELVNITALPDNIADPKFWLTHTKANGELLIDKGLANYFAQLMVASQIRQNPQAQGMPEEQIQEIAQAQSGTVINSLIQQGFIVELEKQFVSKISLLDMQFMINDQQIPLPY